MTVINIIIIAIVTIINLDVYGPRGHKRDPRLKQLVPPSPCSLDKARYQAKRRDYKAGRVFTTLVESTLFDLYCIA